MADPTPIWVDPALADNTGLGTEVSPYGNTEYAIAQAARDAVNGNVFHIRDSAIDVLAADLDAALTAAAWTGTATAPIWFVGYTNTANDGGKFTLSGGGAVSVINSTARNYVHFLAGRMTDCGTGNVAVVNDNCSFMLIEFDDADGSGCAPDEAALVAFCKFHNLGTNGVVGPLGPSYVCFNEFSNGVRNMDWCIVNCQGIVEHNRIAIDGATSGIEISSGGTVNRNSIFSNGGTGTAVAQRSNTFGAAITNNLMEGFSGVGGKATDFIGTATTRLTGGNKVFNCESDFDVPSVPIFFDLGGDEVRTSTLFRDAANGDLRPVPELGIEEAAVPAVVGFF